MTSTKHISKNLLGIFLTLCIMLTLTPAITMPAKAAPGDYDVGNIAVINDIITTNSISGMTLASVDGSSVPGDWTGIVDWDGAVTGQRITELQLLNIDLQSGMLDVSALDALEWLNCDANGYTQLTDLDVSSCTELTFLDCQNNALTALDLSSNTKLETLICSNNGLTTLDVTGFADLMYCDVTYNRFASESDVTGAAALPYFNGGWDDPSSDFYFAPQTIDVYNPIDITGHTAAWIESAIEASIINELSLGNDTLTVIGTESLIDELIYLNIPTDFTVVWEAEIEGTQFYIDYGGTLEIAVGGSIKHDNLPSSGVLIFVYDGELIVAGEIEATSDNCSAILVYTGHVYVYGSVAVMGDGTSAIDMGDGVVYIMGGSVSADGDYCRAIGIVFGNVIVYDGTITANSPVAACAAIYSNGISSINVMGGTLSAISGSTAYAIAYDSSNPGAAAYLTGTIANGDLFDNGGAAVIVEVDTLEIPMTWDGVEDGLTYKDNAVTGNATWDLSNTTPLILFSTGIGISWGSYEAGTLNAGDIAVINKMITDNGLMLTLADPADGSYVPYDWGGYISWATSATEKRITAIDVYNQGLYGTLDVAALDELIYLSCSTNDLTGINLTGLTNLTMLNCSDNAISNLDVSTLTTLEMLDYSYNMLPALDLTKNTALHAIACAGNNIQSIDLSANTLLEYIDVWDNLIDALDVSMLLELTYLYASINRLTSLDITQNAKLEDLDCSDNYLTDIDMSQNLLLENLGLGNNYLTTLDISANVELTILDCSNNLFTSLDVSHNVLLERLCCENNYLSALTGLAVTALDHINCSANQLTSIDVTGLVPSAVYVFDNYFTSETDVLGFPIALWDDISYIYNPQNTGTPPPVPTIVTFTAVQTGGTANTADTTGVEITFSIPVTGLTDINIDVDDDTGEVVANLASIDGLDETWTFEIDSVTTQGIIYVTVYDFDDFVVATPPQAVSVFKKAPPTPQLPTATDETEEETGKTTDLPGGATVTTPAGEDPIFGDDGIITLPGGGEITTAKGATIEAPAGTVISENGEVTFPDGTETVKATHKSGLTFNVNGNTVLALDADVAFGYFAVGASPFVDVPMDSWYYNYVMFTYSHGIMLGTGTEPMTFSPADNFTRGMMVTVLYRMSGSPDADDLDSLFVDVSDGKWYTDAVKWASDNGIVGGYGNGLFGTDEPITRQDAMVILMRYMDYMGINMPVTANYIFFADEGAISDYAKNALQTLFKLGIINGTGTNADGQVIVNPTGFASRAEISAIIARFIVLLSN